MPKVRYQKFITREDVRANPKSLYVFGDNTRRAGFGGQAGAMRGEPNAIGIATKWTPGSSKQDYFSDIDLAAHETIARELIYFSHVALVNEWDEVVFPTDGLGTGLSMMPQLCPKLFTQMNEILNDIIANIEAVDELKANVDGQHSV